LVLKADIHAECQSRQVVWTNILVK
jgi:hypothetical protein